MASLNNFQKAFKDIQTFINRRRGGRKKDEDEDDEANDGEEFNGDKDDEKPGDTKLNGGEHGKIFGINRKIVTGVIMTAFLIVSMATYSAINNHREEEDARKAQPTMQAEEASSQQNIRRDDNGYDALFRQNQKAALAKNGQNGQNPQNPNGVNRASGANGNVTVARPQGSVTVATPTSAAPTVARPVPAIASVPATPAYSTPYTLPSAAASAPVASTSSSTGSSGGSSSNGPSNQEKAIEERYKSAISFGIGGGDTESGSSEADSGIMNSSYTAPSERLLQAGTIVPAILYSGINTANAGQVTAQVASDVYDNATGTNLLIPAGSQLIGTYSTGNANTGRVNVTFSTLVLPNGGSYAIGNNIVAVDGQGYTGIAGDVHHHRGSNFANSLWNSALTALSTLGVDNVTLDTSAFTNITNQSQPTITVDPGYEFNLYVTAPIVF